MKWMQISPEEDASGRDSKGWLVFAFTAAFLAGLLAIVLLAARSPAVSAAIPDLLLVRRVLIAHVNLALVIWPLTFLAAMFGLLPVTTESGLMRRFGRRMAVLGAAWFLFSVGYSNTRPLLSSYLPTIDNPLASAGLLVFAFGLLAFLLDGRLHTEGSERIVGSPLPLSEAATVGLKAAAVAMGLTVFTLLIGWLRTPLDVSVDVYYDALFWGPGHMLQFMHVIGMATAWLILLEAVTGDCPASRKQALVLYGALLVPLLAGPVLALQGTTSPIYRVGFTRMMQFGIAPSVFGFLALSGSALLRAAFEGRLRGRILERPYLLGFLTSAVMVVIGISLGILLRGTTSTTLVAAHFHASVGAVTVAYMATAYRLLEAFEWLPSMAWFGRLGAAQPTLFALGQAVFATGFAVAGSDGMPRRIFCYQSISTARQSLGIAMVSVGGLIAIAGGTLFVFLIGPLLLPRLYRRILRVPQEMQEAMRAARSGH